MSTPELARPDPSVTRRRESELARRRSETFPGSVNRWAIYVTDIYGTRLAELDALDHALFILRHNDVDQFEIYGHRDLRAIHLLLATEHVGIELACNNEPVLTGPVTYIEASSESEGRVTLYGYSDKVWVRARVAHPEPLTRQPPFNQQTHDILTGPASTVIRNLIDRNGGPGGNPDRYIEGLRLGIDPAIGGTTTVAARWQNLLDVVSAVADTAGIGWTIVRKELRFYRPAAQARAVFSIDFETLRDYRARTKAPDANYIYVGGQGELAARAIAVAGDAGSLDRWMRWEDFIDQRQEEDEDRLQDLAEAAIEEFRDRDTVDAELTDTPAQFFPRDYGLGDPVVVRIPEGLTFEEQIRELRVELEAGKPPRIRAAVGQITTLGIFQRTHRTERRVRQLERNEASISPLLSASARIAADTEQVLQPGLIYRPILMRLDWAETPGILGYSSPDAMYVGVDGLFRFSANVRFRDLTSAAYADNNPRAYAVILISQPPNLGIATAYQGGDVGPLAFFGTRFTQPFYLGFSPFAHLEVTRNMRAGSYVRLAVALASENGQTVTTQTEGAGNLDATPVWLVGTMLRRRVEAGASLLQPGDPPPAPPLEIIRGLQGGDIHVGT
jgi:hypothetical protein